MGKQESHVLSFMYYFLLIDHSRPQCPLDKVENHEDRQIHVQACRGTASATMQSITQSAAPVHGPFASQREKSLGFSILVQRGISTSLIAFSVGQSN